MIQVVPNEPSVGQHRVALNWWKTIDNDPQRFTGRVQVDCCQTNRILVDLPLCDGLLPPFCRKLFIAHIGSLRDKKGSVYSRKGRFKPFVKPRETNRQLIDASNWRSFVVFLTID